MRKRRPERAPFLCDNIPICVIIQMFEYTKEEVDKLYSAVENAVQNHNPIDMQLISKIIHAGDLSVWNVIWRTGLLL